MIAQLLLTVILAAVLLYAWKEHRSAPIVGMLAALIAVAALHFVWFPEHASGIAEWAGIGRGVDLLLYTWSAFCLIALLNLHLKIRAQGEVITGLARAMALSQAGVPLGVPLGPPDPKRIPSALASKPVRPANGRRRSA